MLCNGLCRAKMRCAVSKTDFYQLPKPHQRLLLHTCCAPCSGDIMLSLLESGVDYTLFFYNPNIHPIEEYRLRKDENLRFANDHGIDFVDADYDVDQWFERAKPWADEPERGVRCSVCFDMRFERTAAYAKAHGFTIFSSTLGISRWKDMDQINRSGVAVASTHEDLAYWTINWRKQGGSSRMIEVAKANRFYQQEYCGCVYSLRDTNRWRQANNRERIKRGVCFYGQVESI